MKSIIIIIIESNRIEFFLFCRLVFGTKLECPFCSGWKNLHFLFCFVFRLVFIIFWHLDIHSSIKIHSFTPKGSIWFDRMTTYDDDDDVIESMWFLSWWWILIFFFDNCNFLHTQKITFYSTNSKILLNFSNLKSLWIWFPDTLLVFYHILLYKPPPPTPTNTRFVHHHLFVFPPYNEWM